MDWTIIVTSTYWPIAATVIIFLLRKQLRSLFIKNSTIGELLIDLNEESRILSKDQERNLSNLDIADIWSLNDISKLKGIKISTINPVQKFAYRKLIAGGFVAKDKETLVLTDIGRKLVTLAEEIEI